jgi:dipeptidyl aminopeptidase/acylaminoacyl peptidase
MVELPSSFSPDGGILGITQRSLVDGSSRALALPLVAGVPRVIAEEAAEPVFSPSGEKIALVRRGVQAYHHNSVGGKATAGIETTTDLFVANSDGSGSTQITHTRGMEGFPTWEPSGQRLAYVRLAPPLTERTALGSNDSVMEINVDGTCPTKVLSAAGVAFLGVAWRPGVGREAGAIAC